MKEIVIVGRGKLANAIIERFPVYSDIPVREYESGMSVSADSVFVHIGSGRQYEESLNIAMENNSSFIQAATEKDIPMERPEAGDFRFIAAPNLDLNIIRLFHILAQSGGLFAGEKISITESHQSVKTSKAGTAVKMAHYLDYPQENIISVRDPEVQKSLNISNMNQHAFHRVVIGDADSSITIETKIEGAEGYVKGLAEIVEAVFRLENGIHEIEDMVQAGLI